MTTEMKVEDFLQYIQQSRSKSTLKEYKAGINKFSEYFEKTPNEILEMRRRDWVSDDLHQKRRFGRELEKFHKWLLDQGYAINSARTLCLGLRQLFRYFEMPMTYLSREISKTIPTTKDYIPTIAQLKKMFEVASQTRDKIIVSMGLNLGWRIGDFVKIKKDMLPDLKQDTPILFELITEKENVIAKSFLSAETIELLKEYLRTLPKTNPYLFPSNREKYIDADTINRALRKLAKKAEIHIPKGKRLRFHCFRKRFLSECANLHIDLNTAKVMVGKDVEESMLAYLSEVDHKEAFIRLHARMRLTEMPIEKSTESEGELQAEIRRLNRVISGIVALGGQEFVEKAKKIVEMSEIGKMRLKTKPKMTIIDLLETIGRNKELQQQKEYARMIAENNNNNHS